MGLLQARTSSAAAASAALILPPGLEHAVIEHLDLALHRLEPLAAELQQQRRTLVAGQHLLQRQLARLDAAHQRSSSSRAAHS
jgi:hypothetical protein